jgi:pimeloyl-ACP methyl ester carboxylesterase
VKHKNILLCLVSVCLILLLTAPLFAAGCADEEPLTPPPSDGGNESPPPASDPGLESLDALYLPDTYILEAKIVEAQDGLPEYCRVRGYVLPADYFEVRLPTSGWNKKFYFAGCGGFCGQILTADMNGPLSQGYAAVATNAGHWGADITDITFAYYDRQAEIEFSYLAVHKVTVAAKGIVTAYYGEAPAYSYFVGCSNGGRQALMEAQRYPDDFDGIIAQSPGMSMTGIVLNMAWTLQVNVGADGKPICTSDDVGLLIQAIYEICDGQDGNVDGIIDDPSKVNLDFNSLLDYGLTPAQVAVFEKVYGGPIDSSGTQLFPGTPIGSEPIWPGMLFGTAEMPAGIAIMGLPHLQWAAFDLDKESDFGMYDFDFDTDPAKMTVISNLMNVTSSSLSGFAESGGKLLIVHGWADGLVTPYLSVNYYDSAIAEMGGLSQVQDFCLLYLVPGMGHCGPLPMVTAPINVDWLAALEDWVENGVSPDGLVAAQLDDEGNLERTRTLYPYPEAPGVVENAQ